MRPVRRALACAGPARSRFLHRPSGSRWSCSCDLRGMLSRNEIDDVTADDVAHDRRTEYVVFAPFAVRVNMPVQQPPGTKPPHHVVQAVEPLMRVVVPVADAARWAVCEQHVHRAAGPADQPPRSPGRLLLRPLVRTLVVAD